MMKFRTEYIAAPSSALTLDYNRSILLTGSCFADNIGAMLLQRGWKAHVNPCGVLYNPLSIAQCLTNALADNYDPEIHIHPATNLAYSLDFSTKFNRQSITEAKDEMRNATARMRSALLTSQVLFVTFGTAWVYEWEETGQVVANCHKLPAKMFQRRLCSLGEMASVWQNMLERIYCCNPHVKVVFTVSPVRHLADGFEGNSRSKARLLLLCEELCTDDSRNIYFPAYEIVNDDLRDYRFYADDLSHPSTFAVNYIFNKLSDAFISPATLQQMETALRTWHRNNHKAIVS